MVFLFPFPQFKNSESISIEETASPKFLVPDKITESQILLSFKVLYPSQLFKSQVGVLLYLIL